MAKSWPEGARQGRRDMRVMFASAEIRELHVMNGRLTGVHPCKAFLSKEFWL